MNQPAHERQGFLGDLSSKPTNEILELLHRQENIIKNVKFVKKLPDGGAKIQQMIDKLHEILQEKKDVDKTADLFEKMAIDADQTQQSRVAREDELNVDDDHYNDLQHLVNRPQHKLIKDERTYINSYDRVTKRSLESNLEKQRSSLYHPKFLPHRTVKTHDMTELSERVDIVKLKKAGDINLKDFDPTEGQLPAAVNRNIVSMDSGTGDKNSGDVHVSCKTTSDNKDVTKNNYLPDNGESEVVNCKKGDEVDYSQTNISGDFVMNDTDIVTSQNNTISMKDVKPKSVSFDSSLNGSSSSKTSSFSLKLKNKGRSNFYSSIDDHETAVSAHALKELGPMEGTKLKYRYDDSLLPHSVSKYGSAKVIEIDDAIKLQQQQKSQQEKLQTKHAAEKLAQRLGIRMADFDPEGSSYKTHRDPGYESDKDSDEEELDYPE